MTHLLRQARRILFRPSASSHLAALAIVGLLSNANAAQDAAAGTGLGQAAQACLVSHPAYAAEMQQQLAASLHEPAILAFATVMGEEPIEAR